MVCVAVPPVHLVIPDTQCKPGAPTVHLEWIGRYIVDQFAGAPLTVVHLGDHWDMPSLSSYDRGTKAMEGRRYTDDIAAGNDGFGLLTEPLDAHNKGRRNKWQPRRVFLMGNHEDRITRAANANPQFDNLTLDSLNAAELGWEVHGFKVPVTIDGVIYAHYFYNKDSGRPYSGTSIDLRLKTIGHSFTQGHQQGLLYGLRQTLAGTHHGLVAGSCYIAPETYRGPQARDEWRGIIVKHEVENGSYCPMFVSLDYLARKYAGKRFREFLDAA